MEEPVLEILMVVVFAVTNVKHDHRQNLFPHLGCKNRGVKIDYVKGNSYFICCSDFLVLCLDGEVATGGVRAGTVICGEIMTSPKQGQLLGRGSEQ